MPDDKGKPPTVHPATAALRAAAQRDLLADAAISLYEVVRQDENADPIVLRRAYQAITEAGFVVAPPRRR